MGMNTNAPTLRQFQDRFPTEEACLEHLFQVRHGTDFNCPKCDRPAKYSRVKARRSYQCNWCANQLYPTAGTPFDRTRTSLRDWFYVMFLFTTTRNGVAAKRVEREQEHDIEPIPKAGAGAIERGSGGRIKVIGAPLALV